MKDAAFDSAAFKDLPVLNVCILNYPYLYCTSITETNLLTISITCCISLQLPLISFHFYPESHSFLQ